MEQAPLVLYSLDVASNLDYPDLYGTQKNKNKKTKSQSGQVEKYENNTHTTIIMTKLLWQFTTVY